jgi:PAT family beta-lactamase induction signal transducer AmpG
MVLGMMLPGMASGFIQNIWAGNFFIWVFLATIPGLILSRFNFSKTSVKRHKFMER